MRTSKTTNSLETFSIPAAFRHEFHENLIYSYETAEATEVMNLHTRRQIRSKFE